MSPDGFTYLLTLSAFGSVALGYGLWQRWREQQPRGWLRVPGTVLASRMQRQYAGRGRNQYVAEVEYEYRHKDRIFKSTRIRMSHYSSGRKREADTLCSRYPAGGSVTVLVDPEEPESAVLEYGPTLLSSVCIGLGLSLGALALLPVVLR